MDKCPLTPAPAEPGGALGGSGQATGPRYLSPTKFLRVDFFCEQECDFFFVIYVNKVVLVLFFFTKWIVPELRHSQT